MNLLKNVILKLRIILTKSLSLSFTKLFYFSYYHSLFVSNKKKLNNKNYLTTFPNRSAGIGHQLTDLISAYSISKELNLNFCFTKFQNKSWNDFFSFFQIFTNYSELQHYNKVKLPRFNMDDNGELSLIIKIINSYDNKTIFICEIDQFFYEQTKYINAKLVDHILKRVKSRSIFKIDNGVKHLIGVHVRRGDILSKKNNKKLRFLPFSYFKNILNDLTFKLNSNEYKILIFSNESKSVCVNHFKEFDNVEYFINTNDIDSFANMVNCSILITSKSSFSYNAAILSNNTKICPRNFWHSYSNSKNYILASDKGHIKINYNV